MYVDVDIMSEHHILVLCFTICSVSFTYGQFESQNNQFQQIGDPSLQNLKFNFFGNPFDKKDAETKSGALQIPDGGQDPNVGTKTTANQNGVRRKFGSRQSWRSKFTKTGQISPSVSNDYPSSQPGLISNGIANPFLKQKPVIPSMQEKPTSNVQPPPQTHDFNPATTFQDIGQTGGERPVVPHTPATNNADTTAEEFEFGGESFLVPCQWGGCIGDFRCMRFENGRAIVCNEDSIEFCQCMKKKVGRKASGSPKVVPVSSIPVPDVNRPEVTTSDSLSSVPDDMEIGGEKLPGLPCYMSGCLEPYSCMSIKLGRPISCQNLDETCQCMKKKTHDSGSPDPLLPPATDVPFVLTTDSVIPCQFWGCESGFECLLEVNGRKRSCPSNSDAVCRCVRHVFG